MPDAGGLSAEDGLSCPGYLSKEQRHRGFRFISESSIIYSERAEPAWPPAGDSAAPTTASEESAIGGRRVAQDTADTVYQSAVGLNRPRDM